MMRFWENCASCGDVGTHQPAAIVSERESDKNVCAFKEITRRPILLFLLERILIQSTFLLLLIVNKFN